jgi:hypothetical protein
VTNPIKSNNQILEKQKTSAKNICQYKKFCHTLKHNLCWSGDVTETLAQVIMKEVDWSPLPNNVPVSVKFLLQRCLERDPRQRLRDVGEARIELERSSNGSSRLGVGEPSSLWLRVLRRPVYPVALGLVLVLVGSVLGRLIRTDVVVSGDLMRLAVNVPPAEQLMIENNVDGTPTSSS